MEIDQRIKNLTFLIPKNLYKLKYKFDETSKALNHLPITYYILSKKDKVPHEIEKEISNKNSILNILIESNFFRDKFYKITKQFKVLGNYYVIPSIHEPRILIQIPRIKKVTPVFFNIYSPANFWGIIKLILLKFFASIGNVHLILRNKFVICIKTEMGQNSNTNYITHIHKIGMELFGKEILVSIHLGSRPRPEVKYTGQFIEYDSFKSLGFFKIGKSISARKLLLNEISTLKKLRDKKFSSAQIQSKTTIEDGFSCWRSFGNGHNAQTGLWSTTGNRDTALLSFLAKTKGKRQWYLWPQFVTSTDNFGLHAWRTDGWPAPDYLSLESPSSGGFF